MSRKQSFPGNTSKALPIGELPGTGSSCWANRADIGVAIGDDKVLPDAVSMERSGHPHEVFGGSVVE